MGIWLLVLCDLLGESSSEKKTFAQPVCDYYVIIVLFKQDKSVKDVSLKKMEERDKKKMDQLKKKLHTDDEGVLIQYSI